MPKFRFKSKFIFSIFFIFFIFFISLSVFFTFSPTVLSANRPFNPFLTGNSTGEPMMDLGSVVVEKESLTIDLRELVNFKRSAMIEFTTEFSPRLALVETVYKVRNDKEPQDISFTMFGDMMSFQPNTKTGVWLDDQLIEMQPYDATEKDLPINWGIPNYTISIHGNWRIPYRPMIKSPMLQYKLQVPTGSHTIRICYFAQPSTYLQGEETIPWQFVYVLTPARDWGEFKGLDATIYIPKGWLFSSNLKLTAQEDKITGSWQGVPGNNLSLTIQVPSPNFWKLGSFVWLLGPFLCLGLGTLTGKLLGKYRRSLLLAIPLSIIWGASWALLIFLLMNHDQNQLKSIVGESQLARPNNSFVKIASLPFAFTLGLGLAQVAAFFSHRNIVESKS